MATVKIDVNFKPPREAIRKAVDEGALASANFVKKKADQFVPVGKIKRPLYVKGKYKGKSWTARRPGQLKRTGYVVKSKFKNGGAIVLYGSFNAFYAFMRHWGTVKIKGSQWLKKAEYAAAKNVEREIAGRIKAALK